MRADRVDPVTRALRRVRACADQEHRPNRNCARAARLASEPYVPVAVVGTHQVQMGLDRWGA